MKFDNQKNLWLLVWLLFVYLIFLRALPQGMFFDGVTYATVARNMAEGIGSPLHPYYTKTFFSNFYEHPPLVLILQAGFFKLCGDHLWVERLYSVACGMLALWLLGFLWAVVKVDDKSRSENWLPCLIWFGMPLMTWSYSNNLLENTLTLFILAAVLFFYKSLEAQEGRKFFSGIFCANFFLQCALLSKGPIGLFPLITPICYFLAYRKNLKKVVGVSLLSLVITFTSLYLIIHAHESTLDYFLKYTQSQLSKVVEGSFNVFSRLTFLKWILEEGIFVIPASWIFFYKIKQESRLTSRDKQDLTFFIFLALFSSLPIMLSSKMNRHYLIPSTAFYALAFSHVFLYKINLTKKYFYVLKKFSLAGILVGLCLSYPLSLMYGRDGDLLEDLDHISLLIPEGSVLGVSKALEADYSLMAYLMRIHKISLDSSKNHENVISVKQEALDKNGTKLLISPEKMNKLILIKEGDASE